MPTGAGVVQRMSLRYISAPCIFGEMYYSCLVRLSYAPPFTAEHAAIPLNVLFSFRCDFADNKMIRVVR